MNLARADTYINVYLPRVDGEDPRKWARPSSPVFHEEEVYKFSDEIVKDRKLFLDKKQMSLYEIYYKDDQDPENHSSGEVTSAEEAGQDATESDNATERAQRIQRFSKLPRVAKVSISLDQKLRRNHGGHLHRFNEHTFIKSHLTGNHYNPSQSLERQVTSYNFKSANRRKFTPDIKSAKARTEHISRLFKKVQSAPSDPSKFRTLGLPPIGRSNTALTTLVPDVTPDVNRLTSATSKTQPLRPSSKPHSIWRQTTNFLVPGTGSLTFLGSGTKHAHATSSRSRLHTAGDILA